MEYITESNYPRVSDNDNRKNLMQYSCNLVRDIFRSNVIGRFLTWIETTTEDQVRLKAMKNTINDICWNASSCLNDEMQNLFCSFFAHEGNPMKPLGKDAGAKRDWDWVDK